MRPAVWRSEWDLAVAAGVALLAALAVAADLPLVLRAALGLPTVLVLPGYALLSALYPERAGPGTPSVLERLGLATASSVALVAAVALAMNATPWGIRPLPIAAALALVTVSLAALAAARRAGLPSDARFVPAAALRIAPWREHSRGERLLVGVLALAILAAAGSLVAVVTREDPAEQFTEFYVLSKDGTLSGYPTSVTANESFRLVLGVVSHERASASYLVRVVDAQSPEGGFAAFRNATLAERQVALGPGVTFEEPIDLALNGTGVHELRFELWPAGAQDPTKILRLFVRV